MQPRQALQNLDGAVAQMQLNREAHTLLQLSSRVLSEVLKGAEEVMKERNEFLKRARDLELQLRAAGLPISEEKRPANAPRVNVEEVEGAGTLGPVEVEEME